MLRDWWYALRRLRARPWHTAIVVTIFAVGTGAALSVFRIADTVLLRALPYPGAERLVRVSMHNPIAPTVDLPFSDVGYRAIERRSHAFDVVASYRVVGVNLAVGHDMPERVLSARVTGNFFDIVGLPAERGRLFVAGQEAAKGPPVVVLSDGLWRRSFGASDAVIGSTVRVDGAPATVIGVADARVALPAANVGLWSLMSLDVNGTEPFRLGLDVVARVRAGTSMATATTDATRVIQEVAREYPGPHTPPGSDVSGFHSVIQPIRDDLAGGVKPTIALLSAAVLFVLCLTCVNVATLELVRSSERRAELAIRTALGADRSRLIGGALIEGGVQAVAGGALGLVLSGVAVTLFQNLVPTAFAVDRAALTPGIVGAAIVAMLICAAAAGVFPVAVTRGSDVQAALRDRGAFAARRTTRVRRGLIVLQISFACVLVDGASLTIVSVRASQRVALGFRPEGLVVFRLSLPAEAYRSPSDVSTVFRALADKVRAIPGVASLGLASNVPLDAEQSDAMIGVEGRPFRADGSDPSGALRIVTAGYFDAMGLRPIAGRAFSDGDSYLDGTPVVISQSLAKVLWPDGTDPIGHRLRIGPYSPWMAIVGVMSDVKNRSLTAPSTPEFYLPFGAPRSPVGVSREMTFVVRTAGPAANVQRAAQRAVLETNRDLPIYGMRRFDDLVSASQVREVTTMRTLSAFAAIALLLAISGAYAMLMFAVVQRRHELALRHAIGATSADVVGMIGREMAQLLATGVGLGLAGTLAASRLLSRFLFGVTALDARVLAVTILVVSVAGLGAALIPARRAASIDPMLLLRS